jgi:hypothetical protein
VSDDITSLSNIVQAWFGAQPGLLKVVLVLGSLAATYFLWIVVRVLLVALRAAFRGL